MMDEHEEFVASKVKCCRAKLHEHTQSEIYSNAFSFDNSTATSRRVPVICSARNADSAVRRLADDCCPQERAVTDSQKNRSVSPTYRLISPRSVAMSSKYQSGSPLYRPVSPGYRSVSPASRSVSPAFQPISPTYSRAPFHDRQRSASYHSMPLDYRRNSPPFRRISPNYYTTTYSPYRRESIDTHEPHPEAFQQPATHYKTQHVTILQNENKRTNMFIEKSETDIPSPSCVNTTISPLDTHLTTRFVFPPAIQSSELQARWKSSELHAQMATDFPSADYNVSSTEMSRGIRKRQRTIFTPSQLRKLEEKFKECSFIVGEDRQMLAEELKLREQQVKIWFQNRRTKFKQMAAQEMDEERKSASV